MKLRYKISIFGIAVIGILATAFIFRYELLQAYGSGKILNNLSLSGTPTHGEKLMIYFDDGKGDVYPELKFNLQFLTPDGAKTFRVESKYDDYKECYYATIDVPKNAFYLYAHTVDAPVAQDVLDLMCEGKGEYDSHNYIIKTMNNGILETDRKEKFKEDEIKFPQLYERYIAKWQYQNQASYRRDLTLLENINREKLNPISKISLDLAILNAYFNLYDHKNVQKAIARLDQDLSSDPQAKEYFSKIYSNFNDYFFWADRFQCKLLNPKTNKYEQTNLMQDLLEVAIKHDIKEIYYEYSASICKDDMNLDKKFSQKLAKHIANAMIRDLEQDIYQPKFYNDYYIFKATTDMLSQISEKKFKKEIQKINSLSTAFLTNLKAKRVSQDTTDYFRLHGYFSTVMNDL